jgi:transcriptional repressor NrdR
MRCPFCHSRETYVKDSRVVSDGNNVRRKRYCEYCKTTFKTTEQAETTEITIIKKNGAKKLFDRDKLYKSIEVAFQKRAIKPEQIQQLINKIIIAASENGENEIKTSFLGDLIMTNIKEIDVVAYVRYASVYCDFNNIKDFERIIAEIKNA